MHCTARSSENNDKEFWLGSWRGGFIKRYSARSSGIRTRSAGSGFGVRELLRDVQQGVGRIRTRSAGMEFGGGKVINPFAPAAKSLSDRPENA